MDIDQELMDLFNEDKKNIAVEFPYYYINLCKLTVPIVYKPLVDSNGLPFRYIRNLRQGSVEIDDEEVRFRLIDKDYFNNLTSSQKILIDNLHEQMDLYNENHDDEWMFVPTKSTIISYCVLINLGDTEFNKLKTSLIVINSARYLQQYKPFINDLKVSDGEEFINYLFSRSIDYKYLLKSESIREDGFGYKFDFNIVKQSGEIPQEAIDRANDLNTEYIDITNFNEEFYSKILDALIKLNKEDENA